MASFLSNLCTPAFVYFVLGMISIVIAIGCGMGLFSILAKIILILIWTWFLNYLCLKDLKGLSWFLVILPFLFILVAMLFAVDVGRMGGSIDKKSNIDTTLSNMK